MFVFLALSTLYPNDRLYGHEDLSSFKAVPETKIGSKKGEHL